MRPLGLVPLLLFNSPSKSHSRSFRVVGYLEILKSTKIILPFTERIIITSCEETGEQRSRKTTEFCCCCCFVTQHESVFMVCGDLSRDIKSVTVSLLNFKLYVLNSSKDNET